MKKISFILLFIFLLGIAENKAQSVPKKLDSLFTRTLDSMQKVLKNKALSAAIQLPNNAVWSAAKGISAENPYTPANVNQAYLIGSVVKTLTAACVLQLVDEKKIGLDDPLYKWVDTFKHINPNITIRQLLQHQSGIYDVLQNPQLQPAMLAKRDSIWNYKSLIINYIKPATFAAGASWDYSNTNYFLLAMIIEKATGQPYYKEFRKRFFIPLGLKSFTIPAYEALPPTVAHVWLDLNGDGILDDAHSFYTTWRSLNSVAGSAGAYYALPEDVVRWMRIYMRGDLLSAATMEQAKKTVPSPALNNSQYGLGLIQTTIGGLKAYGHGGDLSYSATTWYFPEKDICISLHTNDSKKTSWSMLPVVAQLLKTYLKNEKLVLANEEIIANPLTVKVVPNPILTNAAASITLSENVKELKLLVSNALGENVGVIEKQNLSAGAQWIDLSEWSYLPQGVYAMSVWTDGKWQTAVKFLKE
jgi:CubicO group peptidase (beta-lactamase class C family)